MCACVFLFVHSFPCQTNKKNQNIRSGQEMRLCRVPMPCFLPSASRRRHAQHISVAHIDRHMHTTDTQKWSPPSLSSCVCLGVEVSGDKQKTTCASNLQLIIHKTNGKYNDFVLLTSMTHESTTMLASELAEV